MNETLNKETDDYDLEKLNAFKAQLGYQFAIFVKVVTGGTPGIACVRWV